MSMHDVDNILVCIPWLAHTAFYLVFPFCYCQGLDGFFLLLPLFIFMYMSQSKRMASTSIYNHIHVITHPIVTPTHSIPSSNLIAMLFIVISSSIKKKSTQIEGCSINRTWLQRDVRKGTLSHASSVKYRA